MVGRYSRGEEMGIKGQVRKKVFLTLQPELETNLLGTGKHEPLQKNRG